MRKALSGLAVLALGVTTAAAQDASIWSHQLGNSAVLDTGWYVTIPSGPSDFFSSAYDVVAGLGNNPDREVINGNMKVNGIAVSVTDFGTTRTYPQVGVFRSNLPLDPRGLTPDLSSPIATSTAAITTGTPLFTMQYFP